MNNNVTERAIIRPVTLEDAPGLIEAYNETSLLGNPIFSQHERTEFLLRIEEYRLEQVPLLAGCNASGQVRCWGGYLPVRSAWDTSRTVELFIYPDLNNSHMINALIAIARERGKHSVVVQMPAGHEQATRLYDTLGFRRAGYFKQAADVYAHQQRARAIALERGWDPGPEPSSRWIDIVQYELLLAGDAESSKTRQVYVLPGERIVSNETFGKVIGEVINGPDGYFSGGGLDALNDCLRGGFGTPDEPYIIIWQNSQMSRQAMGYDYTVYALQQSFEHAHPSWHEKISADIERARRHEGPTEFDKIVKIIKMALRPELILL